MDSLTAQSDNIPENREIGYLPTDDAQCKKQLLEGIIAPNKVCLAIGAKSKFSDAEEINDVEKTDKKRRKSSEKRVRFNDVVDVCEEPASLFNALDDGSADFASLTTHPLRSIVTSRSRRVENTGDCINVEDFQERYNHLNKGTSVWRRRQRKQFNNKSFGDFIGSQDFTAPLATMDEIDCFSDESPDFVFKDFDERGEQMSPVLPEGGALLLLTHEECVSKDPGHEDRAVEDDATEDDAAECLTSYEAVLRDTSAVIKPLVLNEDLKKDLGRAVQDTDAIGSDSFTEEKSNCQVVEGGRGVLSIESRSPPHETTAFVAAAAADDAVALESASTDESEANDIAETIAFEKSNDTREGTRESLRGQQQEMRECSEQLTATGPFTKPDEFLMIETVTEADKHEDAKPGECLATNDIMKIDESKVPGDIFTAESKISVPDDILTVLESKVPDDILTVLESKVPVEITIDESRVPEPDELSGCSVPQESVMVDNVTVPDKLAEMNIMRDEVLDAGVPLVPLDGLLTTSAIQVGDGSHLIMTEGLAEQSQEMADNEMRQQDYENESISHEAKHNHVTREKEQETSATVADDDITRDKDNGPHHKDDDFKRPDQTQLTTDDVKIGSAVDLPKELPEIDQSVANDSLPENSPGGSSTAVSSLHSSVTEMDNGQLMDDGQLVISGPSSDESSSSDVQLCNAGAPVQTHSVDFHSNVSSCDSLSTVRSDSETSFHSSSNSRDSVVRQFTCVLIPNLIWLFHSDDSASSSAMGIGHMQQQRKILTERERRRCSAGVANPRPASRLLTEAPSGVVRKTRPRSGCN